MIELNFEAEVIYWRGPAPFFFAPVPPRLAGEIRQVAKLASYGWGVIPVEAVVGGIGFETSLFPREDTYLLPLKNAVRQKARITAGDTIAVAMTVKPRGAPVV